jgi:hypothetical protein
MAAKAKQAHNAGMTELACKCGAVYEVIETKGPARDDRTVRCVLCDRELLCWVGSDVGQFRLIRQPEGDRE